MKIIIEASIDESPKETTESAIKRLNAEIQKAPTEMLPVLHFIHSRTGSAGFFYSVCANVTDSSGETRSGTQSIRVGHTSMQAGLTVDERQPIGKPMEMTIVTSALWDLPHPPQRDDQGLFTQRSHGFSAEQDF